MEKILEQLKNREISVAKAACMMGVSTRTVHRRMVRAGIERVKPAYKVKQEEREAAKKKHEALKKKVLASKLHIKKLAEKFSISVRTIFRWRKEAADAEATD